ncbi:MAG: 16S rRNA (uracil(1498)-N(3))-methyltransferase [Coleofasciculaceae cyanobacterium SM2_1_6]|nr:16S rRNA (uracil(1498)-N(3))-methyltransferase [Coleofasciculaceae cyanobacterium SM2_1_6]
MPQRLVIDPTQRQAQLVTFTKPQQHYLHRVLRLQAGDQVIVLDGLGGSWLVAITGAGVGEILEPWEVDQELPIEITLMVALPKNGFDEVVYQATELGVGRVIPVISDRTLLRPSPQKIQRWRSIAQEATEQSERRIVPQIVDPVSFRAGLELTADLNHKYICTPRHHAPPLSRLLPEFLEVEVEKIKELVVLTGCEGGFTEQEVEGAIDQKFQLVSLGKPILRAVTAPIVALALIASKFD